jgi:septum formation protein
MTRPENAPLPVPPGSLVLASASPRRRDILSRLGLDFEIRPSDIDESVQPGEKPGELVVRLALGKARAVAEGLGESSRRWVLGADTVVVLGEETLGKPRDPRDAESMLGRLLGQTHRVLTGVAVVDAQSGREFSRAVESDVIMRPASEQEIRDYVAGGEPLDKAGAYALQGDGRRFVRRVIGSESNVIGLPVEETLALLAEAAAGAVAREAGRPGRGAG